ncbi:type VII secretion-associated serine protease mycosin [Kitasatospora sp. KL5]|uniref:type VII secretion-associated serine protease mycosin n=1 Tax=Kitasatospora sp. KL5 TaxID=3425125 RepID=UPI003D701372
MTLTRAMRALGATTLAGALLLTAAPGAAADQVRDGQWANQYFQLEKVWSVTKGEGVTVAVIDSGVDATHPDLTGQVLPGYDESGKNLNTKPTDSHGTGMASLIAGHGHGGSAGVVGLAPGVKILPVYKGDASGLDVIPQGIRWAVDHGAKVINISQAATITNSEMDGAVAYAYQHDVLVVAGAGNTSGAVANPANLPGVLAVAAVDKSLEVWAKSNSGPEIRLAAPGAEIVSAGKCGTSQYCLASGTSDATAYVSAAAALVRAKFPDLTAGQVANRLVKSAALPVSSDGAKLPDLRFGYGVIRPYEALTMDIPVSSPEGPLTKPEGAAAPGAASPGAVVPKPVTKSSGITPLHLVAGAAVLVVLFVIVVVVATRSRRRPPNGPVPPQGPAPYGAAPGWPPAQQPYGTQPPPPGYPQQQPYQNPYQGGNPPR